jgi:hypothetical protein
MDENACIFHCEKNKKNFWLSNEIRNIDYSTDDYENGKERWNELFIGFFWEKFNEFAQNSIDNEFIEINFPNCDNLIIDIKKSINKDKFFFRKCKFLDTVDFNEYLAENFLFFDNCFFYGDLYFNKNIKCQLLFVNDCVFDNNSIYATSAVFYKDLMLSGARDINQLNFNGTEFKENSDFSSLINLKVVDFDFAIFRKVCTFFQSSFLTQISFHGTKFEDYVIFSNVKIKCEFDLSNTLIANKSNFLKIEVNKLNRETARIIKDSFEQQNNIIEANKFYALEMKEREIELSPKKDFFEWLVFKIHGLSSNHSQNWFSCLLWIIIFSFVVGLFNQKYYFEVDKYIFISLILLVPIFIGLIFDETKRKIGLSLFIILFYWNTSINLNFVSNLINPFSIMTGKDELTFGILIYKITIAYLIYQLIISIRQNTRRK